MAEEPTPLTEEEKIAACVAKSLDAITEQNFAVTNFEDSYNPNPNIVRAVCKEEIKGRQ